MTLREQLNDIDVTQCVMSNGKTVQENFINEADRLERILTEVFTEVLATRYKHIDNPMYERTGQLLNSIVVDVPSFKVNKKTMSIEIGFSKTGFHHSGDGLDGRNGRTLFYTDNSEPFDVATAFYNGYKANKTWFSDIYTFGFRPQFGFFDGTDFMQEAIDRFQAGNYMGIQIDIIVPEY